MDYDGWFRVVGYWNIDRVRTEAYPNGIPAEWTQETALKIAKDIAKEQGMMGKVLVYKGRQALREAGY